MSSNSNNVPMANDNQQEDQLAGCLPNDLMLDILYRATPKALVRCTSVCKSWNSLIKSSHFISRHLQLQRNLPNDDPLLLTHRETFNSLHYDPLRYALDFGTQRFDQQDMHVAEFPTTNGRPFFDVLDSCLGLVCVFEVANNNLVLWNPCIERSIRVSFPEGNEGYRYFRTVHAVGLGFASNYNDYRVLRAVLSLTPPCYRRPEPCALDPYTLYFQLYSLTENSWVDITDLAPPEFAGRLGCWTHSGNRFLNCIALFQDHQPNVGGRRSDNNGYAILSFDFNDEIFQEISLPRGLSMMGLPDVKFRQCLTLSEYDASSLALVCRVYPESLYDVWVMKKYGVVDSWTKLFTIRETVHEIRSFMFRKNGELLVKRSGKLRDISTAQGQDGTLLLTGFGRGIVSCDPRTNQFRYLAIWKDGTGGYTYVNSFVQSLVLLDRN